MKTLEAELLPRDVQSRLQQVKYTACRLNGARLVRFDVPRQTHVLKHVFRQAKELEQERRRHG